MKVTVLSFFCLFLSIASWGQTPMRVEHRIHADSTTFELNMPDHAVRAGQTIKVKLHVKVKKGWHVYTHDTICGCCPKPLNLHLPDSLMQDFEILSISETGRVTTRYDSNFMCLLHYHTEPFDAIATLKARCAVRSLKDFRIYVGYQAVDSLYCMPPSWYEVSARKRELVTN